MIRISPFDGPALLSDIVHSILAWRCWRTDGGFLFLPPCCSSGLSPGSSRKFQAQVNPLKPSLKLNQPLKVVRSHTMSSRCWLNTPTHHFELELQAAIQSAGPLHGRMKELDQLKVMTRTPPFFIHHPYGLHFQSPQTVFMVSTAAEVTSQTRPSSPTETLTRTSECDRNIRFLLRSLHLLSVCT